MYKLDAEQGKKFAKWDEKHKEKCPYGDTSKQGAIGGRLTFCFTPTSIGCIVKVKCACGEEIDVTNVDDF